MKNRCACSGAVPSVQLGYDTSSIDDAGTGFADEASGWMVGLNWSDLFMDGNRAGVAVGSRVAATSIVGGGDTLPIIENLKLQNKYSCLSTGGGSLLTYLEGGSLPILRELNI